MVCAPVFQRIAEQVLEYLHVPHDVELPASRQLLMAERHVKDQDLAEGSPDHLGQTFDAQTLDTADAGAPDAMPASASADVRPSRENSSGLVAAALREREPESASEPEQAAQPPSAKTETPTPVQLPLSGTVVLDVEQGGIVVPSFVGKSVRSAIEIAEQSGLDMEALGSGVAVEQNPVAGSHVAAGATITVKFGR
jgi:cell division protein FtsI (penicillin-binding protein 3)